MIGIFGRVYVFVIVLLDFLFNSLYADIDYYIYPKSHYPSFGNGGTIGLIQMPTARMLPAGSLAFNWNDLDPYQRGSIIGQPFDWFEASYQYTDVNNALYSLTPEFSGDQSYKDKGFDIKLRLLKETALLPAVAVGMRDLAGTNVFSAEYLVASKRFNNIDISLGMGWGTYANNGVKNPIRYLGDNYLKRDVSGNETQGGEFSVGNWLSGEKIGIFGGAEIFLPNLKGLRVKIEYDSTDYELEGFPFGEKSFNFAFEDVRQPNSPVNIGFVYPVNENFHVKAGFIKGNTINFGFSWKANLGKKNPLVKKKAFYKEVEQKEAYKLVTAQSDDLLYRAALANLNPRDYNLQVADVDGKTLKVVYSQDTHRSWVRSTGRVIRVLDDISHNGIEEFEVSNVNGGLGMFTVTMNRNDFKENQFRNTPSLALQNAEIKGFDYEREKYEFQPEVELPALFWNIAPSFRTQVGGPDGFFFLNARLSMKGELAITETLSIKGGISASIFGDDFSDLKLTSDSVLPHVRTDIVEYLKESNEYAIDFLQIDKFFKVRRDVFAKATVGLVENMFGAYGGELLWRPFTKNYAIGIEAWQAKQRDYNMMFDFKEYEVKTGFLNLYIKEPRSQILFALKGGRFLAGDSGFNFDFSRRFKSGLRMGAFFSLTDISEYEFGEGSFDKGFYFFMPIEAFWGNYSKESTGFGLRPLTRDGAAFMRHSHSLYGVTEQAELNNFTRDWDDLYE